MERRVVRPGMFIRPLALVLIFFAVVVCVLIASGGGTWIAIGLLELVVVGGVGVRLLMVGVGTKQNDVFIRNFFTATRIPNSEVRSIGFRSRPGYGGTEEWVGYLEQNDGSGLWIWATEAGRATGAPHASMVKRLTLLCEALGQPLAAPRSGRDVPKGDSRKTEQ